MILALAYRPEPERLAIALVLVLVPAGLALFSVWLWRLSRRRFKASQRGSSVLFAVLAILSSVAFLGTAFYAVMMMGFVLFYRQ